MRVARAPLFYDAAIARTELHMLTLGTLVAPAIDVIAFENEAGGDQQRDLAVPLLPGMDEFVVTKAELSFRASDMTMDVTDYTALPGPGGGVVLSFPAPARLRKIELRQSAVPTLSAATARLVVRPMMTKDQAGPPIFAAPDFGPPGSGGMFGRILTGLDLTELGNSRYLLNFPDLLGTAWLLQLATGATAVDLQPMAATPRIERVAIAAAPRNLSVTLAGSPPTPLWGNPGVLIPASGEQKVSFLPIAQRRLSTALADAPPTALTLPLTLLFHSDSGGSLEITDRALDGQYHVRPLGDGPVTLRLAGRPVPLLFSAPAARLPAFGRSTMSARLLGRALNSGSPPAPLETAAQGLRAAPERMVASCLRIAPRNGDAAPVPLASVALRLDTPATAELVLELRSDVAGRPGPILAPPLVQQLPAGFADWLELVLTAPLPVAAGSTLWAAIRLTHGTALWHAGTGPTASAGVSEPCVSADRGASWRDASRSLGLAGPPLVQAFHVEDPPEHPPEIRCWDDAAPSGEDWLAGAEPVRKTEFRLVDAALPDAVLTRLNAAVPVPGEHRADTRILLYSPSVLDLVLTGTLLGYDPL